MFGKSAGIIFNFGKTSARSVGLSTQAATEAAATFGNLFVAMKIGQKPAADMSVGLVRLAGDLGSFNNVDPTQVLEDLRSGLVGEVEPLRKYGIALNAASVEQEAMRETGKRNVKQLTEADKVTARYNLILKNTKTAQGDFARTSGGLANQQRILNAEWKDAQASFGKALLPAMLKGVKAASSLASGFTKLNEETHGFAAQALLGAAGLAGVGIAAGKTVKFLNESKTAWAGLRGAKVAQVATDKAVGDAELVLAGKTRLAGDAAATSAGKFKLLSGGIAGLARFGGIAAIIAGIALGADKLARASEAAARKRTIADLAGDPAKLAAARDRLGEVTRQLEAVPPPLRTATLAGRQLTAEQGRLTAALAGFSNEGAKVSERVNLLGSRYDKAGVSVAALSGKLHASTTSYREVVNADKALHDQLISSRDAILSQADAFEHGKRASKVKTSSVLADLRNEVATLKTWAADAQRLIRRGMSPEAVLFLSQKGPEYLRAFASGSDKAVAGFERLFKQRMKASGDAAFNTTSGAAEAFRRMVAKANAETARIKAAKARAEGIDAAAREFRRFRNEANTALGGIVNRNVTVRVKSGFSTGPGGGLGGRGGVAGGGLIDGPGTGTSDTAGLFRLSRGEIVVSDANVRRAGGPRAVAQLLGIRHLPVVRAGGMASGGVAIRASGDAGPIRRGAAETNAKIARIIAEAAKLIRASTSAIAGRSGSWKAATNYLTAQGIPYSIISTYRPGARTHASGSVSYHALNRAVDLDGGHDKLRIWRALDRSGIGWRELIYSRAPTYIGRGVRKPISRLDPVTRSDHYGHVHVALGGGGIVRRPTMALLGERGPEAVVPLDPGRARAPEVHLHFYGPVYGGKAGAREVADMVYAELLAKKGRTGRMHLGLA